MNKNQHEFTTPLEKTIWKSYIEIFHPDYSTFGIDDTTLKQSCLELYAYVTEGMADMAAHTEAYEYIPPDRLCRYEVYAFHHIILEKFLSHSCIKEKDYLIIGNAEYDNLLAGIEKS